MRILFSTVLLLLAFNVCSQEIDYRLSMPEPHTHYYEVTIILKQTNLDYLDLYMPVWTPGSYKVRDFSKNVENLFATSNNLNLTIKKLSKNTWRVQTPQKSEVRITYKVYAYENSVRTSFLDMSHGYVNGASVFMTIKGLESLPIQLTIEPFRNWKKVSTSLTQGKKLAYKATNYDELIDSPIEIGNHSSYYFEEDGVKYEIAFYGQTEADTAQIFRGIQKIVKTTNSMMSEVPLKKYVFIIQNLTIGSGGLEHSNSTMIQMNRWTYENPINFYGLVAHEYFHLWNAKRIRPLELSSFNYHSENYSKHLWLMEGFTSYYENLILMKADMMDLQTFLNKTASTINYIESQPGVKVQSISESSFDAWIKFYQPNENSSNSSVSYYSKGKIVALLLDLFIIDASKGERNLDDLLTLLYQEFYISRASGYTEEELINSCSDIAGKDMKPFFEDYVYGLETPDYQRYFKSVGIKATLNEAINADFGAATTLSNGKLKITSVTREGSAYESGLNVNDEIIAIDGYRILKNELSIVLNSRKIGDRVSILIARDGLIKEIQVELLKSTTKRLNLSFRNSIIKEEKQNFGTWIRLNDER